MWAAGWSRRCADSTPRACGWGGPPRWRSATRRPLAELDGRLTRAAAIAETAQATRRFVRRQESWLRPDPRIVWLDALAPDLLDRASPRSGARAPVRENDRMIRFAKGHGTRNDFVLVDDRDGTQLLTARAAAALADRRRGIGGDGVIRVGRTASATDPAVQAQASDAEWFMDYRNADGSIAEMCGNGFASRDLSRSARGSPRGGIRGRDPGRIKQVRFEGDEVTVDMGTWAYADPPPPPSTASMRSSTSPARPVLGVAPGPRQSAHGRRASVECRPADLDLREAPAVNPHPTAGTNVESSSSRSAPGRCGCGSMSGGGETPSCGTGVCAAAIATHLWAGGLDGDVPWRGRFRAAPAGPAAAGPGRRTHRPAVPSPTAPSTRPPSLRLGPPQARPRDADHGVLRGRLTARSLRRVNRGRPVHCEDAEALSVARRETAYVGKFSASHRCSESAPSCFATTRYAVPLPAGVASTARAGHGGPPCRSGSAVGPDDVERDLVRNRVRTASPHARALERDRVAPQQIQRAFVDVDGPDPRCWRPQCERERDRSPSAPEVQQVALRRWRRDLGQQHRGPTVDAPGLKIPDATVTTRSCAREDDPSLAQLRRHGRRGAEVVLSSTSRCPSRVPVPPIPPNPIAPQAFSTSSGILDIPVDPVQSPSDRLVPASAHRSRVSASIAVSTASPRPSSRRCRRCRPSSRRPARRHTRGPSAVVSATTGRITSTPSRSAWNCMSVSRWRSSRRRPSIPSVRHRNPHSSPEDVKALVGRGLQRRAGDMPPVDEPVSRR